MANVIKLKSKFIRANTILCSPPLLPELKIYSASDATDLWKLTEREMEANCLEPPFWAFPWSGGQAIARYILDNPSTARNKCVLDLAAGSGIAGLAAILVLALRVDFSEIDPFARQAIRLNARANNIGSKINITSINPMGTIQNLNQSGIPWDLVLAGDVFYEANMAEQMLISLSHLANCGVEVLVGDPGRYYLPEKALIELTSYKVPTPETIENTKIQKATVYRLPASN